MVFSKGSTKPGKDTRPEKRILLLSGLPGIGKTTLAHILAQHSGYHPLEINASDDRTKGKFKPKMEAAIEMASVFGDRKPNLLIIDEIDGISPSEGSGVAQILIELASGTKKPLRRPIICVCNDPYAPALRKLRRYALLYRLEKPKTAVLCNRLLEVCKAEGISTDAHTLSGLCSLADNDIRSCLNTLQFMRRRNQKVTSDTIRESTVGQKDASKSIFTVWDQIFHPQHKKKLFQDRLVKGLGGIPSKEDAGEALSPFFHLNNLISCHGDIEKVVEGCHSHYLGMRYLDTSMEKVSAFYPSLGLLIGLDIGYE